MARVQRNTTTRDQHRATIRRTKPPCAICGEDIDYKAHHTDPRSFSVDHIIPLSKGGPDTIENKQPAHRKCNRDKSNKTPDELKNVEGPRTFITHRKWT
ncbi:HNH endonuclease [Nocardia sp. 852002-20019_SCH5090214]|uniref:HNH endonuclease n=1 Tax=Nocardia sp. 852002-20019_SCH5090214 TaxID=1834087 RepID=UPI0007E92EA0|nr:HNH endonuclease [Nocardia sp. 852002-20019_SCH5090214]OBA62197.1 HNH endonuclease [Nocardia sp. 852002-20019_SCH5090214]